MADQEDSNTKVAFWLVGGAVAAAVVGVLAYASGGHRGGAAQAVVAPSAEATSQADDGLIANKTLVTQVFFDLGKSEVSPESGAALQAAVAAVGEPGAGSLVLSGFHDASGSPEVNARVAKARAFAVRDALLAAGVDVSRIRFERPQITLANGDPKLARRVDISIAH